MMNIKKIDFLIILALITFIVPMSHGQNDKYESYLAIKENPLNLTHLEIVESDTSYNYKDLIHLLISNCALNRQDRVQQLLLDLAEYGVQQEYINQLLSKSDCKINRFIDDDPHFKEKYQAIQDEFLVRIENDSISKLIHSMHELDQESRRIYKISSNEGYIKQIDSINLENIESWLNDNKITSKKIGVKSEEKLYIMMLHSLRYIPEAKFKILSKKLRELVLQKDFHPIYFANIVDERLRVKKSSEYPKYNFLRSIELSKDKESIIQNNRRRINAY